MTRVVVAVDKFKGSLTAAEASAAVARGVLRADPAAQVIDVRVGDGGDGTLEALLAAGFERIPVTVGGPTGQPVHSAFGLRHPQTQDEVRSEAFLEMADLCGLVRLPGGIPAPREASSRGLGEAIRHALNLEPDRIVVGVGGSAGTDGGAGMLAALGVRLLDADGRPLPDGGAALRDLAVVDLSGLDPRVHRTEFVLAGDVDNPLLGPHGAAAVFGPQKGADAQDVADLEAGLTRFADLLTAALGRDDRDLPGAGAAGGVGYAAQAVLDAVMQPGIEMVLDIAGFDDAAAGADLVITGEGRLDHQTLLGKTPAGVAGAARDLGVPAVVVCGHNDLTTAELADLGIRDVVSLTDVEPDRRECHRAAGRLVEEATARLVTAGRRGAP